MCKGFKDVATYYITMNTAIMTSLEKKIESKNELKLVDNKMEFPSDIWGEVMSYFHSSYKKPSHYEAIRKAYQNPRRPWKGIINDFICDLGMWYDYRTGYIHSDGVRHPTDWKYDDYMERQDALKDNVLDELEAVLYEPE